MSLELAAALLLLAAGAPAPAAQTPTLEEVLRRAGAYVRRYEAQLGSVLAEEQYDQSIISHNRVTLHRHLVSDFLLLRLTGEKDEWFGFRDVFKVDGNAVRDRQERLQKLFFAPSGQAVQEARRIAAESARYNIGAIERDINVPTFPLWFLEPLNQPRFTLQKLDEKTLRRTQTWVIGYHEHAHPTFIGTRGGDLLSRGSLWVEPNEGHVLRTELVVEDERADVRSRIVVDYAPDEKLGIWVPVEMKEHYETVKGPRYQYIECQAIYSRYRKFEVQSETKIEVPR